MSVMSLEFFLPYRGTRPAKFPTHQENGIPNPSTTTKLLWNLGFVRISYHLQVQVLNPKPTNQ